MARRRKKILPQTVTISSLSFEGRGLSHDLSSPSFIVNALPNEEVVAEIRKHSSKKIEGIATEIITPSNKRITPLCEAFGRCGGCSLQHLSQQDQIQHKEQQLKQLVEHKLKNKPIWEKALYKKDFGYRTKARMGVKYVEKTEEMMLGFREHLNSKITRTDKCHTLIEKIGLNLDKIKNWLLTLDAKKEIPQIEVAATQNTTALILRHLKPLSECDLNKIKNFAQKHNYRIYLQPKGLDTIHLFYPETDSKLLDYTLEPYEITLYFQPQQFTQVHQEVNQAMIEQALNWLEPNKTDTVLDLFCGIGNFSLPLATKAKTVVGVEADNTAINMAKYNQKINQLDNLAFYTDNLFEKNLNPNWQNKSYNKLLIDPPRQGAEQIVNSIETWNPEAILYVSCHPHTLIRDAVILEEKGYRLEKIGIMDMFSQTAHIETMALFKR